METKTIKISLENYKWLIRLAGRLQQERSELVSMDDVFNYLREKIKTVSH